MARDILTRVPLALPAAIRALMKMVEYQKKRRRLASKQKIAAHKLDAIGTPGRIFTGVT